MRIYAVVKFPDVNSRKRYEHEVGAFIAVRGACMLTTFGREALLMLYGIKYDFTVLYAAKSYKPVSQYWHRMLYETDIDVTFLP